MGSELRRQLREALGPDIKGLQRAVALEIADDARWDDAWNYDAIKGRRSKARLADLVRWTAAKNERVVRDALRNLALAGWEFRLPIGKGADGRLLYAVPGLAMQYRVPDFTVAVVADYSNEGTVTTGPMGTEGPATAGPSGEEGPATTAEGPATTAEGPATTGPPSLVSPCSSRKESPSSSVAEVESEVIEGEIVEEGGGGGDSSNGFIQKAEAFVDALDYRGKPPSQTRRAKLAVRVVAAFKAGWNEQTLRDYLDTSNDPSVRDPAAVYAHRLKEDELPEAPTPLAAAPSYPPACAQCFEKCREAADKNMRLRMRDGQPCPDCHPSVVGMVVQDSSDGGMWGRAMDRAQARMASGGDWSGAGTDERVAGWMALSSSFRPEEREHVPAAWLPTPSTTDKRVQRALEVGRQLQAEHDTKTRPGGHKPYSNDIWERMKQQAADGVRPDGADGHPHCGTCDEYTRTREVEGPSGPHFEPCSRCHPALSF